MVRNITPAEHLADVRASFAECPDPRLAQIMRSLVEHAFAFVEDVKLTRDEWFAAIDFLTRVGQTCDDRRQEFILLSDTLGISMLVEMIDQDAAAGATEPTVFGPFHVDDAPERTDGASIVDTDMGGEPLRVGPAQRCSVHTGARERRSAGAHDAHAASSLTPARG